MTPTEPIQTQQPASDSRVWPGLLVVLAAVAFVLAHLVPTGAAGSYWGFALMHFAGWPYAVPGLALVAVAAMLFHLRRQVAEQLLRAPVHPGAVIAAAVVLVAATSLYSVGHNFYGDGGLAVKYAQEAFGRNGEMGYGVVKLIHAIASLWQWSTDATYRTVSLASAALFVAGLVALSARTCGWTGLGAAAILFGMLQITATFFFAYRETYAVLSGVLALCLSTAAIVGNRPRAQFLPVALHAALALLHPVFLLFLPAFACRFVQPKWGARRCLIVLGSLGGLGVVLQLIVSAARGGPGISDAMLPFVNHAGQAYGIFSSAHFRDLLNLGAATLGPAVLALAACAPALRRPSPAVAALLPYALTSAICLFAFDFKLGGLDWDIFATVALPIMWLAVAAVFAPGARGTTAVPVVLLLIGASLFRFVPWMVLNRSAVSAAPYVYAIAQADSHQQSTDRRKSLGLRFLESGLDSLYLRMTDQTATSGDSLNPETQNNYAVMLMRQGKDSLALATCMGIIERSPGFALSYGNVAQIYERKLRNLDSASRYYRVAWSLDTSRTGLLLALARCEAMSGRLEPSRSYLEHYVGREPGDADAMVQLAMVRLALQDTAGARQALYSALDRPLRPESRSVACAVARGIAGTGQDIDCESVLAQFAKGR